MSQHKQDKIRPAAIDVTDRRALATQYTPYVRHIAARIKRRMAREIEFDDLVEYGMIGLLEAADRFDPKHGANFMTFAYYRVRGAIYDGLRGMGWLNRNEYARVRFEGGANAYLQQSSADAQGTGMTAGVIGQAGEQAGGQAGGQAGAHDAPDEGTAGPPKRTEVHALEHAVQDLATAVRSLATVYITSLDAAAQAQLADEQQLPAEEILGLEQRRHTVRQLLKKLPEQEREIMQMYYYGDLSLQQIGEKLGLSKSWMSRVHARIVDKLQRMLKETSL